VAVQAALLLQALRLAIALGHADAVDREYVRYNTPHWKGCKASQSIQIRS
jgi:hypothetical protein